MVHRSWLPLFATAIWLAHQTHSAPTFVLRKQPLFNQTDTNPTLQTLSQGARRIRACGRAREIVLIQKTGLSFHEGVYFTGKVVGAVYSDVRLFSASNGTSGVIIEGEHVCQITSQGDGTASEVELDPDEALDGKVDEPSLDGGMDSEDGLLLDLSERASATDIIDICVFYTDRAKSNMGTDSAISNVMSLMEVELNEGFENSGLATRARIVHSAGVSYDEDSGSWVDAVYRFQRTSDGKMDEVHPIRRQFGCDLNILLIRRSGLSTTSGIGFVGSRTETAFAVVDSARAFGYDVTSHEVGHNLGCGHDEATSAGRPGPRGVNSWSNGFVNKAQRVVTIMAYRCFGCQRLPIYSQPSSFRGVNIGDEVSADCTRTIRERTRMVSGFLESRATSGDPLRPTPTQSPDPEIRSSDTDVPVVTRRPEPNPTSSPQVNRQICRDKGVSIAGGQPATVTIQNAKRHSVDVNFVMEGEETLQGTIAPGETRTFEAFVMYRMRLRSTLRQQCLRTFIVRDLTRTIELLRS